MLPLQIGLFLLLSITGTTFAGSFCPPRSQIHPCSCFNVHLSKRKVHTTVVCHGLENTAKLNGIMPALSRMDIDNLRLYDSFWTADDNGRIFQNDFLALTNIKEIHVEDSSLSPCFACQWNTMCRNTATTMINIINSTTTEKICTLCPTDRGSKASWISCLSKLEKFQLSFGNLKSITADFFPLVLNDMKVLNFSHNSIAKIDGNAFKNLPKLKELDLSYNVIEHIDHTFGAITELQFIDVSHNFFKMIGPDLFPLIPHIKSINLAFNRITELKQSDFSRRLREFPKSLRLINLTGNSINCDCNLKWLNNTMPVHVAVEGTCSGIVNDEFAAYRESTLRAASRHMNEKCELNRLRTTIRPTRKSKSRS